MGSSGNPRCPYGINVCGSYLTSGGLLRINMCTIPHSRFVSSFLPVIPGFLKFSSTLSVRKRFRALQTVHLLFVTVSLYL